MASEANKKFALFRRRARRLLQTATDQRLRPLSYENMEPGLHASLAGLVSAWEAYIEAITLEAIDCLVDPSDLKRSAIVQVLRKEAQRATESFNTPNFDNARTLLLRYTGFDAYTSMQSPRLGLGVPQTQTRLNEILRVRHSFAHGLPIPNYSWLSRYGVSSRLTKRAVENVDILLGDLVAEIDRDLGAFMVATFL